MTIDPVAIRINESRPVLLRCLLTTVPRSDDSVYVIWRFRSSSRPPPPKSWLFLHHNQEDDVARCHDPPYNCSLLNTYEQLRLVGRPSVIVNAIDPVSSTDAALIRRRQLHSLTLLSPSRDFDGTFQCYVLFNLDAIEDRAMLQILSKPPPT